MSKINKGIGLELGQNIELILTAILAVAVSFFIDWQLSLVVVLVIPVIGIGVYAFTKVWIVIFDRLTLFTSGQLIAKETTNESNAYSNAGHIVQEVFSSLRTVLSLNGGKFEQKR